ncbi:MAG: sigma factor [Pseudonocardia sp.]
MHRSRLLRLAAASGTSCAEEAVQETFVRAWRACRSFEPRRRAPRPSWCTRCTIAPTRRWPPSWASRSAP